MKSSYTIHALPLILTLPVVFLALLAVPAVRRRMHPTGRRLILMALLVGYTMGVAAITIFPINAHSDGYWHEPWWSMVHPIPFYVDAPSMVLNVLMFVPFGVLVPLLRSAADSYRSIARYAAFSSLGIEVTQLVIGLTLGSRRTVDVNDLIANAAGAALGLLVLRLAVPSPARRAQVSVW